MAKSYVLLQNIFSLVAVPWSSKVHWTLPRKARIYKGFSNLDLWGSVQKLVIETAKWKNICFWQAYVNTSLKQSNSERDAESQLQLQCRSAHRRGVQINSHVHSLCKPYVLHRSMSANSRTEMDNAHDQELRSPGNVMDEASLQGVFMETTVIQEVKACPRFITETPVEFNSE